MAIRDWLENAGIAYDDHGVPGYGTPGNPTPSGTTTLIHQPAGVLIHHTGSANTSLNTVINGRTSVPGPLYQVYVERNGTVNLITDGRANHAGQGNSTVLDEIRAEVPPSAGMPGPDNMSGNRWLWSVSLQGPDHPLAQYRGALACAAAILMGEGWSENRLRGHKEWTTRKIDPSAFSMDTFRQEITVQLSDHEYDVLTALVRGIDKFNADNPNDQTTGYGIGRLGSKIIRQHERPAGTGWDHPAGGLKGDKGDKGEDGLTPTAMTITNAEATITEY